MSARTSRFVEFEINGRSFRIHGDPLTTICVYIVTFWVFYVYDKFARKESDAYPNPHL